ncbi:MAG: hypothetical protein QG597_3616, partial [Actinomycetota bacterium]|nr:hypothetical protein [Actinomycetota bacterium]
MLTSTRSVAVPAAALAALLLWAAPAEAGPDVENAEDQSFMELLDQQGVLFSFNLEKYQGQWYCRDVIDGVDSYEATENLMRDGGYSHDVANSITSAAGAVYCFCAIREQIGAAPWPESQC